MLARVFFAGLALILMPAHAHDGGHAIGHVPREIVEKPVVIRAGTGNAQEKVSTSSKDAQAFYDQGLNYLHSYVWIEAARSFHQALRHDPKLVMAWVGLSRAYSGLDDPAAAQAALDTAKNLSDHVALWEQTRIELRQLQLTAMADPKNAEKFLAYKSAIDKALSQRLDDVELWLIRGNAEEPFPAGRGQRGGAASIAFYKQALAINPDHSAAHHYLVHSYEVIGQIGPALASGEVYANAAFSVPHAWHMWGHDLRRGAQIEKAVEVFSKADQLERDYYETEGIAPKYDWHHGHNLDLLAGSYQYMGKIAKAEEVYTHIFNLETAPAWREGVKATTVDFFLNREMWDKAEAAATKLTTSSNAALSGGAQILLGHAALGRGDKPTAEQALTRGEAALAGLDKDSMEYASIKRNVDLFKATLKLEGGASADARDAHIKAIGALRAVLGPDAWIQALFTMEQIAKSARRAGDWELARIATENMLDHDPAYAGSHYATALLAQRNGERAKMRSSLEKAREFWSKADPDFPEMREITRLLAEPS